MPRVLRGRDIVCVGSAGWRAHPWTEEHHLTARLARDNRVVYVEPWQVGRAGSRLSGPLGSGLGRPREAGGVRVLTPPALPGAAGRALRARLVRDAARHLGIEAPLLWGFAPADELVAVLAPERVVYHCLREEHDRERERRFALRADLVLARAPALVERLRALGAQPRFAPAVADTAAFARALADGAVDPALGALPQPRIVVAGSVTARVLDVALLAELAAARPHWSFALVGPVAGREAGALAPLRAAPNVHLLGERPYDAMPEVLRGADAGLVPLRCGPETVSLFPMRVYEYLAAGLPVVATPLPALVGLDGVRIAAGAAEIAAALEEELAGDDLEARRARSALAAGHSWERRIDQVAAALRALA